MGKVKSDEFVPSDADSSTETESDEPKKKEVPKKKAAEKSPEKRDRKAKKERRPLSESEDDEEEAAEPVAKKPKKKEDSSDKKKMVTTRDGQVYWELTHNRRIGLSEFKGRMFVNIREYYEKNGELLPGKKGISLPMEQWKKLSKLSKEIDEYIAEEGY